MRVRVPDVFLSFEFQKDRVENVEAVGVEISPLPSKRHIATACCYRTSRDMHDIIIQAITENRKETELQPKQLFEVGSEYIQYSKLASLTLWNELKSLKLLVKP